MEVKKPIFVLIALLIPSFGHTKILFPSDLITPEKLCTEFRSPLRLKIQEMRKSFRVEEVNPGEIHFLNKEASTFKAIVQLMRSMNDDQTRMTEQLLIIRGDERTLYDETVVTVGTNLSYTAPQRILFFGSTLQHCTLSTDQQAKQITIHVDGQRFFEMRTERIEEKKTDIVHTDISLGRNKNITIRDLYRKDQRRRIYEYHLSQTSFILLGFGSQFWSRGGVPGKIWVVGTHEPGHLIPNLTYYSSFLGTQGVRGDLSLNDLLNEVTDNIYLPYFQSTLLEMLKIFIENSWPETKRRKSAAISSRFLDELILMRQQVEQAQTTPTLLIQIKAKVLEFISAIQEGTLQITDNRPE